MTNRQVALICAIVVRYFTRGTLADRGIYGLADEFVDWLDGTLTNYQQ